MKAILTLVDDNDNIIKENITIEPTSTRTIYEPASMNYSVVNNFIFSFTEIVPQEKIHGYGYIKEDKPII